MASAVKHSFNTPIDGDYDFVFHLVISLGTSIFMYVLQNLCEPSLKRWVEGYAAKHGFSNSKEIWKFPSQLMNFFYHIPPAIVTTWVVYSENWLYEPHKIWEDYPQQAQPMLYLIIYDFCNGYHLNRLYRLVMKPGSDWKEMGAHHVITVGLLASSMHFNQIRTGVLVLMLNDLSDIFVYICKMASVLEFKKVTIVLTFPGMIITWGYWRIYFFYFTVIPIVSPQYLWESDPAVYYGLMGLYGLLFLNIFWFGIFMKMLLGIFTSKGKATHDITDVQVDKKKDKKKN